MYGSSVQPETTQRSPTVEVTGETQIDPAGFGVELNLEELKMVERVKQLKKQKLRHEGDALLSKQDFIGFAKASQNDPLSINKTSCVNNATAASQAERLMMEYDYVAEEAEQLKKDLIRGSNGAANIGGEEGGLAMDSDELEAMEEEEKLVKQMVKKGTMQKEQVLSSDGEQS